MNIIEKITTNKEEQIMLSDLNSKALISKNKNIQTNSRFLTPHEQTLVKSFALMAGLNNYSFLGGTADDERRICVFMPDYPTNFCPICAIRAEKSDKDTLTHRDYLGSLMGIGIKRSCIGDIYVHNTGADIVILAEMLDFLLLEYKKAGRKTIKLSKISLEEIKTSEDSVKTICEIVSSLRLDNVVAATFNVSRTKSAELISKGKVTLNHCECLKTDREVKCGDQISSRGFGRVKLINIIGKSKKNKFIIELQVKK